MLVDFEPSRFTGLFLCVSPDKITEAAEIIEILSSNDASAKFGGRFNP